MGLSGLKTSAIIVAAVILAFIAVYLVYSLHEYAFSNMYSFVDEDGKTVRVKDFFATGNSSAENRLFILGASHVQPLNTTFMHDYLFTNHFNYTVYNFGRGSDTPVRRLGDLDSIISANPQIIVYGISYRDFGNPVPPNQQFTKPVAYLPDPDQIVKEVFLNSKIPFTTFAFMDNPQEITLEAIHFLTMKSGNTNSSSSSFYPWPNEPFEIDQNYTKVLNDTELTQYYFTHPNEFYGIGSVADNENMIALEDIISKLQKHHIKIIIFTTPQSKYFLDTLSDSDKKNFESILQQISDKSGIRIYQLNNNYSNLNVWNDPTHVTFGNNGAIYNNDIARIILGELTGHAI